MEKFLVVLLSILIPMHYLGRGLFNIDLVLIFIISAFIVFRYRIKIFKLVDKFIIGTTLFYVIALFINLYNPSINYSSNLKLIFSIPILLLVIKYVFVDSNNSKYNFNFFVKILFHAVSLISFVVFISYVLDFNIIYSLKEMTIINGFDHWMFHSKQSLFAVLIGFFIMYYLNNKTNLNLILLLFIYLGTFASHGRTAIFTILIGTLLYFIIESIYKKYFDYRKIVLLFLVIISFLFLVYFMYSDTIFDFNSFTSSRFNGWVLNINLILENNTFIGYGLQGASALEENGYLKFKHPHNIYIETLFTLGLIGFILICFLTLFYFMYILKSNHVNKELSIVTFLIIFINSQSIGGIWGYAWVLITLSIIYISSINFRKINNE